MTALKRRVTARDYREQKTPGRIYLTLADIQSLLDLMRAGGKSIQAKAGTQWEFEEATDLTDVPRRQRFPIEIFSADPEVVVRLHPGSASVRSNSPESDALEIRDRVVAHLAEHRRWWVLAGRIAFNAAGAVWFAANAILSIRDDIRNGDQFSFLSIIYAAGAIALGALAVWTYRVHQRIGATKLTVQTASEREAVWRDYGANLVWIALGYALAVWVGSKPATAHQAHRTVRAALGEALRRRHINSNPAAIARPPRVTDEDIEPYSVEDAQQIMTEAAKRPNSARWAVALSLGLRQGEALALRWADVDLDAKQLRVRWTRLRPMYEHGCDGKCGRPAAGYCPGRVQVNPLVGETKSRAGNRSIGLPDQLVELLRQHRAAQDEERRKARQMWSDGDWVFASVTGEPLNPNTDYHEWKALLERAGVRESRLHDARHTAATMLLALGVPERAAMGIMGWSSTAMAARYQHMTDPIRQDIAKRVGGLLWAVPGSDEPDQEDRDPDDGPGGALVPA